MADPSKLLFQVLDDLKAEIIDSEEAVQRLIDGGFTPQGAQAHVYR